MPWNDWEAGETEKDPGAGRGWGCAWGVGELILLFQKGQDTGSASNGNIDSVS